MRKLSRYFVAVLFQLSFAALLLLITIRFQILNPNFLITSLRDAGAYRQSVEIFREYLGDTVSAELQAAGLDKLPIEQQQMLENEILELTSAVEENEIQDLIETNIYRFFAYMNGETGDIILYFPIHTWGLPDLITSQEPFSVLSEKTSLETLMGLESARDAREQLSQVREYIKLLRIVWFIPLILSILLLLIHYLLSISPQKIKPTAWALIISGIYTLLMCGTAYVGSNEFVNRTASYGEPVLLMMGAIIPYLFILIINLWGKIAGGLIFTGVLILWGERKQKRTENPMTQSTVAASIQPPQQNSPVSAQEEVVES